MDAEIGQRLLDPSKLGKCPWCVSGEEEVKVRVPRTAGLVLAQWGIGAAATEATVGKVHRHLISKRCCAAVRKRLSVFFRAAVRRKE